MLFYPKKQPKSIGKLIEKCCCELEKQLEQNPEDAASQNALALHNKIHPNYELLNSLSKEMHGVTPDTIEEKLHSFEIFLDEYGLTYNSQNFNDALQIDCFNVQGYSCAINSDGQILVAMGNDILQLSEMIGAGFVIALSREQKGTILRHAYEDPLTKGANYAKFCVEMNQKRDKGFIISMEITNFITKWITSGHCKISSLRSNSELWVSEFSWTISVPDIPRLPSSICSVLTH